MNEIGLFAQQRKSDAAYATYTSYPDTPGNNLLHASSYSKANVVLSLKRNSYARQFVLEKHSYLLPGVAELPFEDLTLDYFMEVALVGKTVKSYRVALESEISPWNGFARALRKDD